MQINKINVGINTTTKTNNFGTQQKSYGLKMKNSEMSDTVSFGRLTNDITPETKNIFQLAVDMLKRRKDHQLSTKLTDGTSLFFFGKNAAHESGLLVKDTSGSIIDLIKFYEGKALEVFHVCDKKSNFIQTRINEPEANAKATGYLSKLLDAIKLETEQAIPKS